MVKLNTFSRLKNIFNRLNPLNSFDFGIDDAEIIKPPTSDELLIKTIECFSEFEKIILIAIYHLINTQNVKKEYLTVLTKDMRLIADLIEGKYGEVSVPENVKIESKEGNILVTCHNHFYGAIIFSLNDLKNSICPKVRFSIIVSEGNMGILVNEFNDFDEKSLNILKVELKDYINYVIFTFIVNNEKEIEKLDNLNLEDKIYSIEYQKLFDKFIASNNLKFINEFNVRMKKFNLYYLYIKC
jgi:hypothetical protein